MEGASLRLYEEQLRPHLGRTLLRVGGDRAAQAAPFRHQKLRGVEAAGKLLFLRFEDPDHLLRVHCLMFGDVRINHTRPGKRLTLRMSFDAGLKVYVYLGAAKRIALNERDAYDPRLDIMRDTWDEAHAWRETVAHSRGDRPICEAVLDQRLYPGFGNKIKNEALFASRLHPLATVAQLDAAPEARRALFGEARDFSLRWLEAVRQDGDHVSPPCATYRRKKCPRCETPFRIEPLGDPPRKTQWCPRCQPAW